MVDLRREFENPSSVLKTVASRRSRGVYGRDRRPLEPAVVDSRGRLVRAVEMAQTFLSPVQVDELVALYLNGMTLVEFAKRFSVHRRTVAAHLSPTLRPPAGQHRTHRGAQRQSRAPAQLRARVPQSDQLHRPQPA